MLALCRDGPDGTPLDDTTRAALARRVETWAEQGIRALAVATRRLAGTGPFGHEVETGLTLAGFVTFLDRPKEGAARALTDLRGLGVSVRLITGDSLPVARHLAAMVGMPARRILTGRELEALGPEAVAPAVEASDLFVEVDPAQKERIIRILQAGGHTVGFLGDGVNDAPALHAADVGLAVDQAVDVAREAADLVLLERGLDIIRRGIEEGRRTFANTLKYILMTTSANLGNMVSMAGVSLFLPFLPLTAGQILLNNLLSDIPAVGIAEDRVDPELVDRPRRWEVRAIGRYMLAFGLLSSAFDVLTFAVLLAGFHASAPVFRTGWFVESLLTELSVALVVRTRRPTLRSRPGTLLLVSTLLLLALAVAIPYLPGAGVFGLRPLPAPVLAAVLGITLAYVVATEVQKRWYYRLRP
ncbi:MAG TPA: HAD-IC family P-type ATPase [Gemmatimonadales bacterium]|nr:HAD-IC family P-type ATPase [Gemmatimonadales bacterium]